VEGAGIDVLALGEAAVGVGAAAVGKVVDEVLDGADVKGSVGVLEGDAFGAEDGGVAEGDAEGQRGEEGEEEEQGADGPGAEHFLMVTKGAGFFSLALHTQLS
jgi:hypothetical protein